MKVRSGFVANSSSSSFIIGVPRYLKKWSVIMTTFSELGKRCLDRKELLYLDLETVLNQLQKFRRWKERIKQDPNHIIINLRDYIQLTIKSKFELDKFLKGSRYNMNYLNDPYYQNLSKEDIELIDKNNKLITQLKSAMDRGFILHNIKFNHSGSSPKCPEEELFSSIGLRMFYDNGYVVINEEEE